jgi:hypothetical protein
MNKKIAILFLLIGTLNNKTQAQYVYEPDKSINNYFGVQTKVIDYLPIELSYLHSRNNRFSYLLKLSYVRPFDLEFLNTTLYKYYEVGNNNSLDSRKTIGAFSIKSGVMLWHFYDDYFGLRYVSINGTGTYAKEIFSITTEDVIYGKTTKNYDENNIYSTIEIEAQKITRYGLNFGVLFGYKIINPIAFSTLITGIENATTYSPGTGFGSKLYFNIQVGYHFRFKKKNNE